MIKQYDHLECRCRMLGHHVPFKYCRTVQEKLPCFKIIDCWFRKIPIHDFIKNNYNEEEIEQMLISPKSKMASLIDLIEKAKRDNTIKY